MGRIWSVPTDANRGVEVLASWMIDHPAELERLQMKIGASTLDRILLGDVIPDDFEAEAIGLVTGGKVTQAMFAEPGHFPAADDLQDGAAEAAAIGREPAKAVLGEIPPGPLFGAVRDGNVVEVHGCGLAFRLSAAGANALHAALAKAVRG